MAVAALPIAALPIAALPTDTALPTTILPTLLIRGQLQSPIGDPAEKALLSEWIPMEYIINWFKERIPRVGIANRVLILKSETGSGKSSSFPPELYLALLRNTDDRAPGIICTQPRVITAMEIVTEILKHYSKILRLGESIGWSTKSNKLQLKKVGILSATIGTFMNQLKILTDEQIIAKYRFILIDETHERDLSTDMTIYMLKNLLLRNQNNIACPFVVFMSATFDPISFLQYFNIPIETNFIWCTGAPAVKTEMWNWNEGRVVNDYTRAAAIVVRKIIEDETGTLLPEPVAIAPAKLLTDIPLIPPVTTEITTSLVSPAVKSTSESSKSPKLPTVASSKLSSKQLDKPSGKQLGKQLGKPSGNPTKSKLRKGSSDLITGGIDLGKNRNDILIFMPGRAEFKLTVGWLNKLNIELSTILPAEVFNILQIDGPAVESQNRDFAQTFHIPIEEHEIMINGIMYKPKRRVIIATVVAETGLTLENLKYVIDCGYNREVEYNPLLGISALITKPSPQSRGIQRMGRVGRKFPGVFYPLYPYYIHKKLPELQFPQILTSDISKIALDIINEQLKCKKLAGDADPTFTIKDIDMVDVPSSDALSACMEKLYAIGFISILTPTWEPDDFADIMVRREESPTQKYGLTPLGSLAAGLTLVHPESTRMILAGYSWNCSIADLVTIAAWLELDSRSFIAASEKTPAPDINWQILYKHGLPSYLSVGEHSLYKIRLLISDEFINGIILINAIKANVFGLVKFCEECNLDYRACLRFIDARDELMEQMLVLGFNVFGQESESLICASDNDFMDTITRIKYCIYDGYRCNQLVYVNDEYYTMSDLLVTKPAIFNQDSTTKEAELKYGYSIKTNPKALIYSGLSLKFNHKTSIYTVIVDKVSTLDGFVSYDSDFLI